MSTVAGATAQLEALREELADLPRAIEAATLRPDGEAELIRLIARERMLPQLIDAAQRRLDAARASVESLSSEYQELTSQVEAARGEYDGLEFAAAVYSQAAARAAQRLQEATVRHTRIESRWGDAMAVLGA